MSSQHSEQDRLTVYYGIQDALRELGDSDHDAGDGPGLDTPHVIVGLHDAAGALSRLLEQLEAAQQEKDMASQIALDYRREREELQEQFEALERAVAQARRMTQNALNALDEENEDDTSIIWLRSVLEVLPEASSPAGSPENES